MNSTIGAFSSFFKDDENREVAYIRKHNLLFKTFKKKIGLLLKLQGFRVINIKVFSCLKSVYLLPAIPSARNSGCTSQYCKIQIIYLLLCCLFSFAFKSYSAEPVEG